MKPHIAKSAGLWVVYWRGKSVRGYSFFKSAEAFCRCLPAHLWDTL